MVNAGKENSRAARGERLNFVLHYSLLRELFARYHPTTSAVGYEDFLGDLTHYGIRRRV